MTREELVARLLYCDGLMLVVDKPAGIAVHRGPKGGENLEDYFDALRFGLARTPALAHRLDRDTSGCLVLGRHRKALQRLMQLFKQGRVEKTYWAVVAGNPSANDGEIDMPLGRLDADRGWWMKVDLLGAPSQTRWRVLGRGAAPGGQSLAVLELQPLTGRTHQLRVHCAALGTPILGDGKYGGSAATLPGGAAEHRLHLHARSLEIPHPDGGTLRVTAPLPPHMRRLWEFFGFAAEEAGDPFAELEEIA